MSRIPEFHNIIEQIKILHERKNADYASALNPFSNFERSAMLMSWFVTETDKAFVSLIATKLARIAELSAPGKQPNNESLDDSHIDLITYCILWTAYKKKQQNGKT